MFIAVDILLDKVKKDKEVDAVGTVLQMHSQRMKMIQTPVGPDSFCLLVKTRETFAVGHHFCTFQDQFMFIFDVILESLSSRNTQISLKNLTSEISTLLYAEPMTGVNGFQEEFQVRFHLLETKKLLFCACI